jgi:spore coat polysaccharide biosynthesis protein SpsF (cytidylyltransferase family)
MRRVVLVVQARMGSSRLPGKAMRSVHGYRLIEHVLVRAMMARTPSVVVLATSVAEPDQALVTVARRWGLQSYCGPERDVLERVRGAAASHAADVVVRVTGDCPLLAPAVVDDVVQAFLASPIGGDYLWNDTARSGYPDGMDVEVFTREALEHAANAATDPQDREHVTPWIRRTHMTGTLKHDAGDYTRLKLSVDTAEDLARVERIFGHLRQASGPGAYLYDTDFAATIEAARKAGEL